MWVHLYVIHGFEVLGCELATFCLVGGKFLDGFRLVIEVLVVLAHIVGIPMCDGDVVGEFSGAEDLFFLESCGLAGFEDAFSCISSGVLSAEVLRTRMIQTYRTQRTISS